MAVLNNLLIIGMLLFGTTEVDFFPIGVFNPPSYSNRDSIYFSQVKGAGFNILYISTRGPQHDPKVFLRKAEDLGMKVLYYNLGALIKSKWVGLSKIAKGRHVAYDPSSTLWEFNSGTMLFDPEAFDYDAWCGRKGIDDKGWIQCSVEGTEDILRTNHYVVFRIKINRSTPFSRVCDIEVINGSSVVVDTTLYASDFKKPEVYTSIMVLVPSISGMGQMKYRLRWHAKTSLWLDRIEIMDRIYYNLASGVYDSHIKKTTQTYDGFTALHRYYLHDEPKPSHYDTYVRIANILQSTGAKVPPITCIWGAVDSAAHYEKFASRCEPRELLIDWYPLKTNVAHNGKSFQDALTGLSSRLRTYQSVAAAHHIPFWFVVQAHSYRKRSNTDELWINKLRDPTPCELKCMAYMAIANGAKGIFYFQYTTYETETRSIHGLVDLIHDEWVPNEKWYAVQQINKKLDILGPIIVNLRRIASFPGDAISPSSFIKHIVPDDVEVGIFKDGEYDYIMLVNRICNKDSRNLADTQRVSITIDYDKPGEWGLMNLYENRIIRPNVGSSFGYIIEIGPGEGKLFKIVNID